ncbi:hypothetical protein OR263_16685 [Streptomyces sp. NEAU-H22]|uniref:hypothetical protein n=1 Tax=Streptomyces sp. NEAU-H22 TaxID=2994655 RepID=UPI0022524ED2|nr:hypothetical protein [Streptomyces sp. NEAU-H22]MCX3288322.1 hypothetical protein [Streptomyces sp. NEAU-H22]
MLAPTVPAAGMGTVVGAAEVLDRHNQVLDRFPLRADRPHLVELSVGERFLLRGWSPYVPVRRTLVTGGDPTARLATDATSQTRPSDRGRRSTSGWLCLWQGPGSDADGWVPLPPSALHDAEADTTAFVPIGTAEHQLAVQVGGGKRAPACTLVPPGVPVTVDPVGGLAGTRLALRPAADSGYTLLEALRCGESRWATTVAQAWRGPLPIARSRSGDSTLFDLAVAYLHCRQGDVDWVDEWLSARSDLRGSQVDAGDIAALSAWVARRRGRPGSYEAVGRDALDHWALPLTGEGLGLLYEDVIRHPEPNRHIEARVMPLVAAAHSSTLLTYTAPEPGDPRVSVRRPDRSPRGPVRTFRLGPQNDSGVRLTLERPTASEQPWQTQLQVAAEASEAPRRTVYHLSVRCGPRREDRDLMWELARLVMDAGVHDGELRFTAPDHVVVPLTGVPGAARDRLMRIVAQWWFGARRVGTLTLTTPSGTVLLDHDSADAPDPRALPELLRADED